MNDWPWGNEPTTKVTLELTQSSLAFFKKQAKRARVPYQRMLRGLIDAYAKQYNVAV
jgi:predicted DNA binding CopG/RHH family protein